MYQHNYFITSYISIDCQESTVLNVPWKAAALPRCMATDSVWNKNLRSLPSPDFDVSFSPIKAIKFTPSLQIGPNVSNATGTNMCFVAIVAYFRIFLSAAASAAAPDRWTVWGRLVWAKVSATVTSQVRDLPADQGTRVRPSGRFPSSLTSPVGSLIAGIPELQSALRSK